MRLEAWIESTQHIGMQMARPLVSLSYHMHYNHCSWGHSQCSWGHASAAGGTASLVGGTASAAGGTASAAGGTASAAGGTASAVGSTASAAGGTASAAGGTAALQNAVLGVLCVYTFAFACSGIPNASSKSTSLSNNTLELSESLSAPLSLHTKELKLLMSIHMTVHIQRPVHTCKCKTQVSTPLHTTPLHTPPLHTPPLHTPPTPLRYNPSAAIPPLHTGWLVCVAGASAPGSAVALQPHPPFDTTICELQRAETSESVSKQRTVDFLLDIKTHVTPWSHSKHQLHGHQSAPLRGKVYWWLLG